MKSVKTTIVGLLLSSMICTGATVLTSCDMVHQFPEPQMPVDPDDPEDPNDPTPPDEPVYPDDYIKVPIRLIYNTDFYSWEHYYDPIIGDIEEINSGMTLYPDYPGTSARYDNTRNSGMLEVHVKAYLASDMSKAVEEKIFTILLTGESYDSDLEIELPKEKDYRIAVWSHLRKENNSNAFYDPTSFSSVSLVSDSYEGNTDYRDGFRGHIIISTNDEIADPVEINMKRPMGKFELVTIDLSEFLDRETTRRSLATRATADEYHVVVSFPYYFPSSYNVFDDILTDSKSGMRFLTHMTVTGESEASLGFEYVFIDNIKDGAVQAKVDIYDPSYERVAGSTVLDIPIRRDHHTLLRGAFLQEESDGGIGIDPGFDGDHNVFF